MCYNPCPDFFYDDLVFIAMSLYDAFSLRACQKGPQKFLFGNFEMQ